DHHPRQRVGGHRGGGLLPGGGCDEIDETLAETGRINGAIRGILDVHQVDWGVQILIVELQDIHLPVGMKRAMAREAEAEREKRAKVIAAQGEAMAADSLAAAVDLPTVPASLPKPTPH
ncbi:MAG: hypothetical protein RLZ55_1439, partial [Actinomycetota bacterium]